MHATIRHARPDELAARSALAHRSKAHWGYSDAFMAACAAELTVSPELIGAAYVLQEGNTVAGFSAWSLLDAQRAELEFLFVEPWAMGRGYGRRLLAHTCVAAHRAGCTLLEIQGDPHAAEFYARSGARMIGERMSASVAGRMLPIYELCISVHGR